jgi:choline dehydrogenase-like flavoprotein
MTTQLTAADALIIGAGPTRAVAAKRLAEGGLRVVVLEQAIAMGRDDASILQSCPRIADGMPATGSRMQPASEGAT